MEHLHRQPIQCLSLRVALARAEAGEQDGISESLSKITQHSAGVALGAAEMQV